MSEIELGAKVTTTAILVRKEVKVSESLRYDAYELHWIPEELVQPVSGIFTGWRIRKNGYTDYDPVDGNTFVETGSVRCALVTTHPWKNPIFVPLDALYIEPTAPRQSAQIVQYPDWADAGFKHFRSMED